MFSLNGTLKKVGRSGDGKWIALDHPCFFHVYNRVEPTKNLNFYVKKCSADSLLVFKNSAESLVLIR